MMIELVFSAATLSLRWNSAATVVAGQPNTFGAASDQLFYPYGIALDSADSLYIADTYNSRVQKYLLGASSGVTVAGYANGTFSTTSSGLYQAIHVVVDGNGNIYVADSNNQRVQFWSNRATTGMTVAGTGRGLIQLLRRVTWRIISF